jgi:hypothetical protein
MDPTFSFNPPAFSSSFASASDTDRQQFDSSPFPFVPQKIPIAPRVDAAPMKQIPVEQLVQYGPFQLNQRTSKY